ncbi:MAG: helix-turn-helix domain-containing protein [Verrucomicrobiae bacterium]|nr:helix-turn-helix domain-containing protein [Verrucomicrobiae bacterium]
MGLSAGHLHHLCRESLGTNLKSYIIEARLRKALGLLKESSGERRLSIKEISAACGFSSQHLFARQFKKFFHITPLACRNNAISM